MQKKPVSKTGGLDHAGFDTWLADLEELGEERGYFEPVGASHSAILTDEGSTLLVTFERAADIIDAQGQGEPLGWKLVQENGWSNLCILAHDDTWFRDKAVFGYFDRVIDDGFFEDFDRVIFYGANMCGYAAAVFSVAAPCATVLTIQPQATLDPAKVDWDRRFPKMRRTSFTDRFGYAPKLVETAEDVFVVYDPMNAHDAMHASLFTSDNVTHLPCRRLGAQIGQTLAGMNVLNDMLSAAADGELDSTHFYRALRKRRRYAPYLLRLLQRFEQNGQPQRVRMLCNSVTARLKAPRFAQALTRAEQELRNSGTKTEMADEHG